ncbi:helix-turn-helix domain-containing protein [Actinomadura hibisca]|uniref:helix-turn-helix domain-containing protein n=1 Tax=Actinomadura hibisca TaxID=68565 RepID=UPI00082C17D2|nr:helix-turn-helix transcriptional regulator [Actinomadura hibisca]
MPARREPYETHAIKTFARELTAWRAHAGLSKIELAGLLGYTPQYIGQVERRKNIPSRKFAEDLDTFFKTNGLFLRLWGDIGDADDAAPPVAGFDEFMVVEAKASMHYTFENSVITGLFQTPEYAYAMMARGRREDEIQALVARRLGRQEILARKFPPRMDVVFDEYAIRRVIGSREITSNQLSRLAETAQLPNINLQIIPRDAGAYGGLGSALTVLCLDGGEEFAYFEPCDVGTLGLGKIGMLLSNPEVTRRCKRRFDFIRSAALPVGASLDLLREVQEEL